MVKDQPKTQVGSGVSMNVRVSGAAAPGVATTLGTGTVTFEQAKPYLSNRPLRRPNRTRPAE